MASLVSNRGELYARPQLTGELARAWKHFGDGVQAETAKALLGLGAARNAGAGLAQSNGNTGMLVDAIVQAKQRGDPELELRITAEANGNIPGVTRLIADAKSKSEDPHADPGPVDFNEANRVAENEANGIRGDANALRGYELPPEEGEEPPQI